MLVVISRVARKRTGPDTFVPPLVLLYDELDREDEEDDEYNEFDPHEGFQSLQVAAPGPLIRELSGDISTRKGDVAPAGSRKRIKGEPEDREEGQNADLERRASCEGVGLAEV